MAYNPVGLQHIVIVDKTVKQKPGIAMDKLAGVMDKQVREHFGPLWGLTGKVTAASALDPTACNLILLDTASQADFLGVHEMIVGGFPSAKVLVKDCLDEGGVTSLTTTISHEIMELLGDPYANLWAEGDGGVCYAVEASDAVEDLSYKIDGVTVSDFVLRPFFHPAPGKVKLHYLDQPLKPLQTLAGYQTLLKGGQYSNTFSSRPKAAHFAQEDRRFHRTYYRTGLLNLPMLIPGSPEEKTFFDLRVGLG